MSSIYFANSISQHLRRVNCDECSHEKANKKKFPKGLLLEATTKALFSNLREKVVNSCGRKNL